MTCQSQGSPALEDLLPHGFSRWRYGHYQRQKTRPHQPHINQFTLFKSAAGTYVTNKTLKKTREKSSEKILMSRGNQTLSFLKFLVKIILSFRTAEIGGAQEVREVIPCKDCELLKGQFTLKWKNTFQRRDVLLKLTSEALWWRTMFFTYHCAETNMDLLEDETQRGM